MKKYLSHYLSFILSLSIQAHAASKENAHLYYNGDIVTMEGSSPYYAEAILTKNGKIDFVGSKKEASEINKHATLVDLNGKTLLPGFIDSHGHAFNVGLQSIAANLLPPPDGRIKNINDVILTLNKWRENNSELVEQYKIIIGFGYDDSQLEENRHPTANDLDKVSKDIPVLIIHQSGHLAVMNHKALQLSGYNAATKDPAGGLLRRVAGSQEPNGVLEEMAFFRPLFPLFKKLDQQSNKIISLKGVDAYLQYGFTTVQEGRATSISCDTWKELGRQNLLKVDIACYPDLQSEQAYVKKNGVHKDYDKHVRIAGVKLSLDGSVQGRTAWLTKPYYTEAPGQPKDYRGYPAIPKESELQKMVNLAFQQHWQVLAHVNGDAANDELLTAVEKATKQYGKTDRRTVAIHSQVVREDQLDKMKELGVIPSFFSMHTFYWADWHHDITLGPERTSRLSPAQSAIKRNMIFTEHHDAPVTLPNSLMILHTSVNRTSRSGNIIGEDQKITPYQALQSITSSAAFQYFEENRKGTLSAGKMADFVILDQNPLKIAPEKIKDLVVLETIKNDKVVYNKE